MKCIYCLEDKPSESFTRAEHVLPQSFGSFQNNFTLHGVVCDECNQYFGDNLEIDLGRDTFEGVSRYEYGTRSPEEFKSLGRRSRLRLKVADGVCKGIHSYLAYSKELDTLACKPLPQVGFLDRASQEYKYFLLEEIPNKAELETQGLDYNNEVRAFGDSFEKAKRSLADKGIFPEFQGEIALPEDDSDKWLFEIEGSIDKTVCRAIAKISFNYLAYWHGIDFALQGDFDLIRSYIRKESGESQVGEQGTGPFVMVRDQSILADEPSQESRRLIHIITLNWAQNGVSIVSQVSLFNLLSYTVQLAKSCSGQISSLRKGHFFNLSDRRIYELTAR